MVTLIGAMDIIVANVIEELDPADKLCIATKFPGAQVPADYGADSTCKGTLYVNMLTANPTTSFPTPESRVNNCAATLAFPLIVGIYRPAPLASNRVGQFQLPSAAAQSAATDQQIEDMYAMYRALQKLGDDVEDIVIGSYIPLGPEGGVVGGYWTVTIGVD